MLNQGVADTALHNTGAAARDKEVRDRARFRVGRLSKPVIRLIEIMHQKMGIV